MTLRDWFIVFRVRGAFMLWRWLLPFSPGAAEWWFEFSGMRLLVDRGSTWLYPNRSK